MQSKATTVDAYLASLPEDRRVALAAVRKVFLENLDSGFEEGMQYGMIGYFVPHSLYPSGYHCNPTQPLPYSGLASQKAHMSIYLMSCYADGEFLDWFTKAWAKSGKKLNMGKSCIRFKKLDDLALDVLAQAIRRVGVKKYIKVYESLIKGAARPARASTTASKKKTSTAKVAARTPVRKPRTTRAK